MSTYLELLQRRGPMTVQEIRATMQIDIATTNAMIKEFNKVGVLGDGAYEALMDSMACLWEMATHAIDETPAPPRTAGAGPEAPMTACPIVRRP